MTDKFKDQSNFTVAYLASIIGIGIFKDSLSNIHLHLVNKNYSLFAIGVVIVILLLLASYFVALTLLLDNLNITRIPIRRYVLIVANTLMILALLSPLMIVAIWGLSSISLNGASLQASKSIVKGLSLGVATGAFAVAYVTALKKQRQVMDNVLSKLAIRLADQPTASKAEAFSIHNFLRGYELVSDSMYKFLKGSGYSVRPTLSFHHFAKIMQQKGIFNEDDIRKSRSVSTLRNSYIHGESTPTKRDITRGTRYLHELATKLSDLYMALSNDDSNSD